MASLIEIIIDADDRALDKFRNASTEVKKMAAAGFKALSIWVTGAINTGSGSGSNYRSL